MVMKVLDTKWFPQHNTAGLISGIRFIVLLQSGEAFTMEGNKHTHTHTHTHTQASFIANNKTMTILLIFTFSHYIWFIYSEDLCFILVLKVKMTRF